MCTRALSLLYIEFPDDTHAVEASTVINRFSQEPFPAKKFRAWLDELDLVVETYVVVLTVEPTPADRQNAVTAGASMLRGLLRGLELRS
jgi:hypothetical protein